MENNPQVNSTPVLEQHYYLKNIEILFSTVLMRYEDLLLESEKKFIATFFKLSHSAQLIFTRLLLRKGPWFSANNLNYPEIKNIEFAITECIEAKLFSNSEKISSEELFELLTVAELKLFFKSESIPFSSQSKREDLKVIFLKLKISHMGFKKILIEKMPIKVTNSEFMRIFMLLFFANQSQKMTEFVLTDLGKITYEKVDFRFEDRVFQTRQSIEHRILIRDYFDTAIDAIDSENEEPLKEVLNFLFHSNIEWDNSVSRRLERIALHSARFFEQKKDFQECLKYYEMSSLPPSREKQLRLHIKFKNNFVADSIANQMILNPFNLQEEDCARRYLKLPKPNENWEIQTISIAKPYDKSFPGAIEQAVINCLKSKNIKAWHVENSLFNSIFGLCFWDIIFKPVKGAFSHPFQSHPHDMFSPVFYQNRAIEIEERLQFIESQQNISEYVQKVIAHKSLFSNSFVDWNPDNIEAIIIALKAVPGSVLSKIFDRIVKNPSEFTKGFPDLFVLNPDSTYELWEIKGPGDTLKPDQKAWLQNLNTWGLKATCVKVIWT